MNEIKEYTEKMFDNIKHIDEFGNEKIVKNNGEIFKLTNKLKKATLYFIIQTDGTRGFEIEDGWIKSDEEIWDEYLKRD